MVSLCVLKVCQIIKHVPPYLRTYYNLTVLETAVAQWPNVPKFCLGPLEISKLRTLVAQIDLSGNSK